MENLVIAGSSLSDPDIEAQSKALDNGSVRLSWEYSLMPDDDIVPRGFARYLNSAGKMALAGANAEEIAHELRLGIARAVRDFNLPAGAELARGLRNASMPEGSGFALQQWDVAWYDAAGRSPIARAIVQQGQAMLETRSQELRGLSDQQVGVELLGGGLRRWADGGLWGSEKLIAELAQGGARPHLAAERHFQEAVMDAVAFDDLGRSMLTKPGSEIRAPAARQSPTDTADMLNEEIE